MEQGAAEVGSSAESSPAEVQLPRKKWSGQFSSVVVVHNVPVPTVADATWNEGVFAKLLSTGKAIRFHDDPYQEDHRRAIVDCKSKEDAEEMVAGLVEAFDHLSALTAKDFLECMSQAEIETIRHRAGTDEAARRNRETPYEPKYKPESFHVLMEVTVLPGIGEKTLRRNFEPFGRILRLEEVGPQGRTWHITYAFAVEGCAAEFTYHERQEGGLMYSVLMKSHQPYSRMLFLLTTPLTDDLPQRRRPRARPQTPPSSVSEGGCTVADRLLLACGWACCVVPEMSSEPPTPVDEAARDVP